MRKPLLSLLLLVFSMSLQAQETYTINEHGTYVIDSGRIVKVPIRKYEDYSYIFHGFWEDIAVFQYDLSQKGIVIYNIKNRAAAEIPGTASFVMLKILDDNEYFSVLYGDKNDEYIYKFNKTTLELVRKIYVRSLYEQSYVVLHHWPPLGNPVIKEKVGDRTVRYTIDDGKYTDIVYGPEVEMREWWNFSVYYNSNLNRYAIFVIYYDGK
jgi:hypothetical protein